MRLEEHRPVQLRLYREHRGIETLKVPRLKYAPLPFRNLQQIIRLRQTGRNRLLDKHIQARFE